MADIDHRDARLLAASILASAVLGKSDSATEEKAVNTTSHIYEMLQQRHPRDGDK